MAKDKLARNSAEVETSNGEITFIAARSVENLNGWTYDVKSLQAQNSTGDYITLTTTAQDVSIPLMVDHSSSVHNKIGTIDKAWIESVDGIDQVMNHATFFKSDEAQEVRQRILDGELTDVSITTDWGTSNDDTLENAHIIEVSVVYAGAEPKAKILAKNSVDSEEVDKEEPEVEEVAVTEDDVTTVTEDPDEAEDDSAEEDSEEDKTNETEDDSTDDTEDDSKEEEEKPQMATQPTTTTENVATKEMVMNSLVKLAQNGSIRKMNRSQVIEAVKNDLALLEPDGDPYVVPDAVFTEILAATRPTDILETFDTIPVRRFTLMAEVPSEADLARAGRWSKGEQKQIQESDLKAQKFATQFLYKLQELSYEDLQEDFGDLLYAYVRQELPQKVSEEEERDFIVGDGRATNAPRHISSIVSLDAAATDSTNVHVANYDGSGDASAVQAFLTAGSKLGVDGTTYAVMNKATLAKLRGAGLSTAAGLPFSEDTVAGALGVSRIFTREYVANDVAYIWTGNYIKRLTGGSNGETIEQYDIDYNNRKIEFIRPVGGGASGLYSAVKVTLPTTVSA